MGQPGETRNFKACDRIQGMREHAGDGRVEYGVVNTGLIRSALRKKYARQQVEPVEVDLEALADMGLEVVASNLLLESAKIRHNPDLVAAMAVQLAREGRLRQLRRRLAVATPETILWTRN